jgi:hypothetical protein
LHAFLLYTLITVALTWPLAARMASVIPHDLGDPLGFVWILWWNANTVPLTWRWLNAPAFFPAEGAIVFQDSLLGVWPLTSAIQWLGASPVAAYNLLLILSFPLSALTAYLLCVRLSGDRVAGFAGGLAYGFALYRIAQLAHVNVLLNFWVPLVLLSLHEYANRRSLVWPIIAACCWALQGLTSGYFLIYSLLLVGLWVLFFVRTDLRALGTIGFTWLLACAALWPWLSLYRTTHAVYGFERGIGEIETYGADLGGLLKASPLLAIWGPLLGDVTREEQLFPGITLAIGFITAVARSRYWRSPALTTASLVLLALGTVFAAAGAIAALNPVVLRLGGVKISLAQAYKPLGLACLSVLAAILVSAPVRRALRDRSVAAFYGLAALLLAILALGPTIRLFGARIWYKAPYAWLLGLPGFDAVRVPARLWLLVVLCLAIVLAIGLARFGRERPRQRLATALLVCVGLVGESWMRALPLWPVPDRVAALEARASSTPVVELPLGATDAETAAMYRGIYHHAPVVNGYSGHFPPAYLMLRTALQHDDAAALLPLLEISPLEAVIDRRNRDAARWTALVEQAGGTFDTSSGPYRLYYLDRRPPRGTPSQGSPITLRSAMTDQGRDVLGALQDADMKTFVYERTSAAHTVRSVEVTADRTCAIDEVELTMSTAPPFLDVRDRDADGSWRSVWTGLMGEAAVRAALAHPAAPQIRIRFPPRRSSSLQLVLHPSRKGDAWLLAGVRLFGSDCAGK